MLTWVTVVLMTFGLMFAVEEEVFVVVVVEEVVVVGLLELDGPAAVVVLGSSKNDMVSTLDPAIFHLRVVSGHSRVNRTTHSQEQLHKGMC
jgi:hypothetical protein